MPIHQPQQRTDVHPGRTGVQQAEAALVEHYPRLVRLAYVVLPPALGRHRRVLAAHAVVQRALPAAGSPRVPAQSRRSGAPVDAEPAPEGAGSDLGPSGAAYGWMRLRVLRGRWPTSGGPAGGPAGFRLRPRCVRPCRWCGGCGSSPGRAVSMN